MSNAKIKYISIFSLISILFFIFINISINQSTKLQQESYKDKINILSTDINITHLIKYITSDNSKDFNIHESHLSTSTSDYMINRMDKKNLVNSDLIFILNDINSTIGQIASKVPDKLVYLYRKIDNHNPASLDAWYDFHIAANAIDLINQALISKLGSKLNKDLRNQYLDKVELYKSALKELNDDTQALISHAQKDTFVSYIKYADNISNHYSLHNRYLSDSLSEYSEVSYYKFIELLEFMNAGHYTKFLYFNEIPDRYLFLIQDKMKHLFNKDIDIIRYNYDSIDKCDIRNIYCNMHFQSTLNYFIFIARALEVPEQNIQQIITKYKKYRYAEVIN